MTALELILGTLLAVQSLAWIICDFHRWEPEDR